MENLPTILMILAGLMLVWQFVFIALGVAAVKGKAHSISIPLWPSLLAAGLAIAAVVLA